MAVLNRRTDDGFVWSDSDKLACLSYIKRDNTQVDFFCIFDAFRPLLCNTTYTADTLESAIVILFFFLSVFPTLFFGYIIYNYSSIVNSFCRSGR